MPAWPITAALCFYALTFGFCLCHAESKRVFGLEREDLIDAANPAPPGPIIIGGKPPLMGPRHWQFLAIGCFVIATLLLLVAARPFFLSLR